MWSKNYDKNDHEGGAADDDDNLDNNHLSGTLSTSVHPSGKIVLLKNLVNQDDVF